MSDSYKINSVILNQTQNLSTNKNELNIQLPEVFYAKNHEVALSSLYIYYSWFNVSTKFNNNSFSYIWTDGVTYNVNMLDGYYPVNDISNFLAYTMEQNGHFLYDSVNNVNVYYLSFIANSAYYGVTFQSTPIPLTIIPAGITNPNGVVLNGLRPQVIIPSTNNFGKLLGFNAQTMPTSSIGTLYAKNSDVVPEITPITNVNIVCNLANSRDFNRISGIIGSFSAGTTALGQQLIIEPKYPLWFTVNDGRYENISIGLYDQNNKPLDVIDTQMVCHILLRSPKK